MTLKVIIGKTTIETTCYVFQKDREDDWTVIHRTDRYGGARGIVDSELIELLNELEEIHK